MSDQPASKGRFDGPGGLAMIVLAVVVAAAVMERLTRPDPAEEGGPTAATPMPPLRVEGWMNLTGAPPSVEGLRGKWVVIDSWATYCGPCLVSMPKLARLNERWRPRGVELIGLTSEPASLMTDIRAAIDRVEGWDWPVAYGAGLVNQQLGVTMIPNYTLFDPDGKSVWSGHTIEGLEAELQRRL